MPRVAGATALVTVARLLAAAAGYSAFAACSSNPCTTGASRCSDANTREVCQGPVSGDVPLGGSVGEGPWAPFPCTNNNPYCVVLSSGGATCVANPNRAPECGPDAGNPQGTGFCLDEGLSGTLAGECVDGFVNATSVCLPPLVCTPTVGAGALCVQGSSPDGGDDASPQGPDASPVPDASPGSDASQGPDASQGADASQPPDASADASPFPDASYDAE
jgi:hypothetical protein